MDWEAITRWHPRSEFGQLRTHWPDKDERMVVMELEPLGIGGADWEHVRDAWLELPAHPNILEAITRDRSGKVLLRYAAIQWKSHRLHADAEGAEVTLARWGAQLTSAYMTVCEHVAPAAWMLFTNPLVLFDLEQHPRLAFLAVSPQLSETTRHVAPELVRRWPKCDERALVYLIGSVLRELWVRPRSLRPLLIDRVIERCVQPKPKLRFERLAELALALEAAGAGKGAVRSDRAFITWNLIEGAIGLMATNRHDLARVLFQAAVERDAHPLAQAGYAAASEHEVPARLPVASPQQAWAPTAHYSRWWPPAPEPPLAEGDARISAGAYERERQFDRALEIYCRVPAADASCALLVARARCHLELGEAGHAIDYASRAIAADSTCLEAYQLRTRALHAKHRFAEGLGSADELVALTPSAGVAHYLRGRCLFSLGRLAEARAAFDRAAALDPRLIEAMLLRREADRGMQAVRERVGERDRAAPALPPHLAELRPLLAGSRFADAIAVLQGARFVADPDAQLVLAACLVAAGRAADALAVYAGIAGPAAAIGKAFALLELARPGDALAILAAFPDDPDVIEGRARALALLGLHGQADREIDRLVSERGERAELRSPRFRFK